MNENSSETQNIYPPVFEINSLPHDPDKFYDVVWNQLIRSGQRLQRLPLAIDSANRAYILVSPNRIQQHSELVRHLNKSPDELNFAVMSLTQETPDSVKLNFPSGKTIPIRLGSDTFGRPATTEQIKAAFSFLQKISVT